MFDIVAFADPHIGGRWDALDRTDDVFAQLNYILEQVKPGGIVVNLGDTFHTNVPYPVHYEAVMRWYNRALRERHVAILTLEGNHDHKGRSERGSAIDPMGVAYLENRPTVAFFSSGKPDLLVTPSASFIMVPHMTPAEVQEQTARLVSLIREAPRDKPLIGLCHLDIPGATPGVERFVLTRHPGSLPMDLPELSIPDLWLAGHIHKPQEVPIRNGNGKVITVVGSPVKHDFGERDDVKRFIGVDFLYLASTEHPEEKQIHLKVQSVPLAGQDLLKLELDFTNPGGDARVLCDKLSNPVCCGDVIPEGAVVWIEVRITDEEYVTKDFLKLEQNVQTRCRLVRKISPTIVRSREFRMKNLSTAKSDEEVATEYFRSRKRDDTEWLVEKAVEVIRRIKGTVEQ